MTPACYCGVHYTVSRLRSALYPTRDSLAEMTQHCALRMLIRRVLVGGVLSGLHSI
jgi:hypothetical protein